MKYVTLGNGRRVTLASYVAAWKRLRQDASGTYENGNLCGDGAASGERILRQLREGLTDRINRHAPHYGKGRKWSGDWQGLMKRTARDVNKERLIINWLPLELRHRLAHRLTVD